MGQFGAYDETLHGLGEKLKKWNRDVFGDVNRRKEDLMKKIKELQDLLEQNQTDDLVKREEVFISELDVVVEQGELIWFQKSREKYIAFSDRNTRYFHTSTVIRRRRNMIKALKDDEGQWVLSQPELELLAIGYYKKLYSMEDVELAVELLPTEGFTVLNREKTKLLEKKIMPTDVDTAIQSPHLGSWRKYRSRFCGKVVQNN